MKEQRQRGINRRIKVIIGKASFNQEELKRIKFKFVWLTREDKFWQKTMFTEQLLLSKQDASAVVWRDF